MTREHIIQPGRTGELRTIGGGMPSMFSGWPMLPWVMREAVELSGIDATLPVDVFETDEAIVVKAALPGCQRSDIDVSVCEGVLQISATCRSEEGVEEGAYHRREVRYGKRMRSLRLPNYVDASKTEATFDHGMLRLTIPCSTPSTVQSIRIATT